MTRYVLLINLITLAAIAGCKSPARPARVAEGGWSEIPASVASDTPHSETERTVLAFERPGSTIAADCQVVSAANVELNEGERLPVPLELAPTDPPLTLDDLQAIALSNNPTLAAWAARVNAARGKQWQAGRYPNPAIGYNAMEMGNFDTVGQQGGFVRQKVITGGKLRLDQAIAGKQTEVESFQLQSQRQRVVSDVRIRFYDALTAQQRVELTRQLSVIGDSVVTATEKLIAGGQGTANDLLQAEIRSDQAKILLDNATNELMEAWRRLVAVMGVPSMQVQSLAGDLEGDLPQLDWETCYATVLHNHPDLCAARKQVEQSALAIRRAKREPIPDLDLFVSVRRNTITDYDVVNVLAGVPVPIFDRNQGNIRSAQSQWVAARHEVEHVSLDLQDRLAVVYRRYDNARRQTERYRERIVPSAERSLRLVRNGYDQGQVEYLVLLTAQQTFLQVTLSYLDSLQELRAASSLIEGQLLSESLATRP